MMTKHIFEVWFIYIIPCFYLVLIHSYGILRIVYEISRVELFRMYLAHWKDLNTLDLRQEIFQNSNKFMKYL